MNYGNGLALLLTFWLVGFALVAMIRTQRGLAGLAVISACAEPAFAGGEVVLTLQLQSRLPPQDLVVDAEGGTSTPPLSTALAGETASLALRFSRAPARAHGRTPVLRLATSAPFGLFRTWTWLALDAGTLVYPKPLGDQPLPELPGAESGLRRATSGLDELAALRPFREGDSPRQVAWKSVCARRAAAGTRVPGPRRRHPRVRFRATAAGGHRGATVAAVALDRGLRQTTTSAGSCACPAQRRWLARARSIGQLCLARLALFAPEPAP